MTYGREGRGIAPGGVANARALQQRTTPTEVELWRALRGRLFARYKFRRQHPVGPFVLDVCCPARRLAIEVDGVVHDERRDQDAYRTLLLEANGYRPLRLRNNDVLADLDAVLDRILATLQDIETHQPSN